MKKLAFLLSFFSLCIVFVAAQKPASLTRDIFSRYVEEKVMHMQELIGFTDPQAAQLKEMELQFLFDIQKAESCCWCNSGKRIRKLQAARKEALEKILGRDHFIKYDGIENDRIRKGDLRVE